MEFTSSNKRQRIFSIFTQIDDAITQVKEWNIAINTTDDYYLSSEGMQKLAASCMIVVKKDLAPLQEAVKYFIKTI